MFCGHLVLASIIVHATLVYFQPDILHFRFLAYYLAIDYSLLSFDCIITRIELGCHLSEVGIGERSQICISTEHNSQAQTGTFQMSAGSFHMSLHLTIYRGGTRNFSKGG